MRRSGHRTAAWSVKRVNAARNAMKTLDQNRLSYGSRQTVAQSFGGILMNDESFLIGFLHARIGQDLPIIG